MKSSWTSKPFIDCIQKVSLERNKQIQASQYQQNGTFPIIDQGQEMIAGWTDDKQTIINSNLPIIIFGDHTRVLKYIDFPFALGADGTKLVKPCASDFNVKYFYFYLRTLNIPSKGYNRHFKILKEQMIQCPPLPEQKKIAAVLSKLQKAIEIQDNILSSLRDLKKSMMHRLFSYGLKGEKRKKTEIGLIPDGWEVASIGQAFSVTKKPKNIKYSDYSRIPFVPMDFIDFGGVRLSKFEMRSPNKISSGTYFNEGDILIAKITPSFENGKQSIIVNIPNHFGVATTEIIPINEFSGKGNKYYLFYYLLKADVRTMIASKMEGSTGRQRVPVDTLMSVRIPLPSLSEQQEIANILQTIDHKIEIHEGKKASYQNLFKTMLNKLMTETIRVNELDIDTAEVEAA